MEFINSAKNKIPKIFEKKILELYPDSFKNLENYKNKSIFIHGNPGTGKTLKAIAVCLKQRNDKKLLWSKDFEFVNVTELLFTIRNSYRKNKNFNNFNENESLEEIILKKYKKVSIIILDDLGVEKTTDWALQILYLIINYRYENEKITIVTSNYSPEELEQKMEDARIISRLVSMGEIIYCVKQFRN